MSDEEASHTLTDEQTRRVHELLEQVFRPQTADDQAVYHAMRFYAALSTAKELIPAAASCLEAASRMMGHQDQSARVMWLAMQVFMGLSGVMDSVVLTAIEGRLQEMADYLESVSRPQGKPS